MAWQTPKTNWQAADVVRKDDFNRIEGNIQHLQDTKETPAGAQTKADGAEARAKAYTDQEVDAHEAETSTDDVHSLLSDGSIIQETGSNSNGKYIKFANGLQICTRNVEFDASSKGNYTYYTLPASFVSQPFAGRSMPPAGDSIRRSVYRKIGVSANTTQWQVFITDSYTTATMYVALVAIGWWK